jgi:ADP-sugar diphosphatase
MIEKLIILKPVQPTVREEADNKHESSATAQAEIEETTGTISYTSEAGISIATCRATPMFSERLESMDPRFKISRVHFQSVDTFGNRVGFIKFQATVCDEKGNKLPGIVFMRGGSVAILSLLKCLGKFYVILVVQPRLATGRFDFEEIPAGMLDGSGNFIGIAAKELEEELGIKISESELTDLSGLAGLKSGIFASPGASDETIRFYSFCREVDEEELQSMNGRCTGLLSEGEQITLKIVPLEYLWTIADGKTVLAIAFFEKLGLLEALTNTDPSNITSVKDQ